MSDTKEEKIKKIFTRLGADVCGIGSISRFYDSPEGFSPLDLMKTCRSVIAYGIALPKGLLSVEPHLLYSHFNGTISCAEMDRIAFLAAKELEKTFSCVAVPVPCDTPNDYWDAENLTAKGLISMKHTAVACGLGQLGKSTLLINSEYGNRLTVGAVLVDLELISDKPDENICIPGCHRCEEQCPVGAIKAGHVNQKLCRPNTYGKTGRGFPTVECNRCRATCPMKFGSSKA